MGVLPDWEKARGRAESLDSRLYAGGMANPEHLSILKEGLEVWSEWRKKNPEVQPDLFKADLSEVNLIEADLHRATLIAANLRGANLNGADLSYAELSGADLTEARLIGAHLGRANLGGAHLTRAHLSGANFAAANLRGADLNGANLSGTDLRGANLIDARLIGVDLTQANLSGANLSSAFLQAANLTGTVLQSAVLMHTDLEAAMLSGCLVYGISCGMSISRGLSSTALLSALKPNRQYGWTILQVAQFIYLLMSHEKLRNLITTIGEKAVLILGRFTERKEVLDRMADKLRSLGYLPMTFDFDRPTDRDLTETIKVLAGLSRFVIADITNPRSVTLELQAAVPDYMVPFVTILQRGQPAFGMFDDLPRKYHWALPLLEYNHGDTLLATFEQKVVNPALEKAQEVRLQKAAAPVRRSAED